jgi:hypothetical protein
MTARTTITIQRRLLMMLELRFVENRSTPCARPNAGANPVPQAPDRRSDSAE